MHWHSGLVVAIIAYRCGGSAGFSPDFPFNLPQQAPEAGKTSGLEQAGQCSVLA
ncbi:hypothetical protein GCM10011297_04360 [Bacterioplanes sanyensis]|nr:hypothetical protein GCM10011297_04360 [Bacterioplanes sanyensis]